MPGKIAQRAFYERARAGAGRGLRRMGRPDRPELRSRSPPYRIDGRETRCWSRWARSPTLRAPSSITCATRGRRVGTIGVTAYPPVPGRRAGRCARRRPRRRRGRAHRRARRGGQPAHPRAEGGAGRPRGARCVDPDRRLGLRRTRQPGRLRRRPGRRLRLARPAGPRAMARAGRASASGIHRRSSRPPISLRPAGRVQPARPLDRRPRQRDDQQAAGDDHGRAVRQVRPGLSALRLGEEGPARRPTS